MYYSFKTSEGKTLHTHSSLVDESKIEDISKLYQSEKKVQNWSRVFGFWISMEAVNRVNKLSSLKLYFRVPIVLASVFLAPIGAKYAFWQSGGEESLRKLLDGAPVWQNKFQVPDLEKMYYELDDDNNFQPTLLHHGLLI